MTVTTVPSTAATSKRTSTPTYGDSASQAAPRRRSRRHLAALTASIPEPNALVRRALTSQNTTTASRINTRSISPNRQRQLRSTTTKPRASYHDPTRRSPHAPRARLACTGWVCASDVGGRQLLDVHVLEREHAHRRHEAALAIHVPHPRIRQPHLDHR